MPELSVTSPVLEPFHYLQTQFSFSASALDAFDYSMHPFRNHSHTAMTACELVCSSAQSPSPFTDYSKNPPETLWDLQTSC